MSLHDDELPIDLPLVRRLVERSLPQLATSTIEPMMSTGSTNALFRIGDDLLVRLPRQPGGSATIDKEARWLPVIAAGVTAPLPEVIAVGEPGFGYPERWAVTRWIDGRAPAVPWDATPLGSSRRLAEDLAGFVVQLQEIPVPRSAREDPNLRWYRGGPLVALDEDFRDAVAACRALPGLDLDLDRCVEVWEVALAAERQVAPVPRWFHGDLLAENLLVRGGRLAAVLDFGGLGVGNPGVDHIVAWEVLDDEGREVYRRALDLDEATWTTSMGWALLIAMITFPYYGDTMPSRCAARRSMAAAVLHGARG